MSTAASYPGFFEEEAFGNFVHLVTFANMCFMRWGVLVNGWLRMWSSAVLKAAYLQ